MRRSTIYGKNVRGLLRKFGHAKKISEAYDIAFAHQTLGMDMVLQKKTRVAFQGEPRAFSEAAAFQLLSDSITTVRSSVDNPENLRASFCSSLKIKPLRKPPPTHVTPQADARDAWRWTFF